VTFILKSYCAEQVHFLQWKCHPTRIHHACMDSYGANARHIVDYPLKMRRNLTVVSSIKVSLGNIFCHGKVFVHISVILDQIGQSINLLTFYWHINDSICTSSLFSMLKGIRLLSSWFVPYPSTVFMIYLRKIYKKNYLKNMWRYTLKKPFYTYSFQVQ
jgi:hypothetical protein